MSEGVGFVVVRQVSGGWFVMHRGRIHGSWEEAAAVRDEVVALGLVGQVRVARVWTDDSRGER